MNELRPAARPTDGTAIQSRAADLASEILDAAHLRMRALEGLPIRVAEAACGIGALACSIALIGPAVRVVGCDADPAALVRASINVRTLHIHERVTFRPGHASTLIGDGPYDLVTTVFESGELEAAIGAVAPCAGSVVDRGAVIIAEAARDAGFRLWRITDLSTATPRAQQAHPDLHHHTSHDTPRPDASNAETEAS